MTANRSSVARRGSPLFTLLPNPKTSNIKVGLVSTSFGLMSPWLAGLIPSFPPLAEVLNETLGSGSGVVAGGIFSANGLSSIFMHGDFVSFTFVLLTIFILFLSKDLWLLSFTSLYTLKLKKTIMRSGRALITINLIQFVMAE